MGYATQEEAEKAIVDDLLVLKKQKTEEAAELKALENTEESASTAGKKGKNIKRVRELVHLLYPLDVYELFRFFRHIIRNIFEKHVQLLGKTLLLRSFSFSRCAVSTT